MPSAAAPGLRRPHRAIGGEIARSAPHSSSELTTTPWEARSPRAARAPGARRASSDPAARTERARRRAGTANAAANGPFSYLTRLSAGAATPGWEHQEAGGIQRPGRRPAGRADRRRPLRIDGRLASLRMLLHGIALLVRLARRSHAAMQRSADAAGPAGIQDDVERLLSSATIPAGLQPQDPAIPGSPRLAGAARRTMAPAGAAAPRRPMPSAWLSAPEGPPSRSQRHRVALVLGAGLAPVLALSLAIVAAVHTLQPDRALELTVDSFLEGIILGSVAIVALIVVGLRYVSRLTSIAQDDAR